VRRQIAADDPDWWRGAVIYQIYPRSFQDSNGDGIGDLAGIAARLPYVASLGVDAVWISPFFTSPMKDFGYDVADYRGVDPIFGTLEDFDHLVAEAHRLGLKVMIDLVLSHTSSEHPWFKESRADRDNARADWYVWADARDDGTPPNNWLSVFGGSAWEWDTRRRQYYLHNFLIEQPDLNHHNPAVRAALFEEVRFWLERGVDGFRLDAINFAFHSQGLEPNPPAGDGRARESVNPYDYQTHLHDKNRPEMIGLLQAFRSFIDFWPGTAAIGEIGEARRGLELMAAYTGKDRLQMCYSFTFLEGAFSAARLKAGIAAFEEMAGEEGWACWAFSNHDVVRHVTRWTAPGMDAARLGKLAVALLLSLRGSVCVYQGEELGLTEAEIGFADLRDPWGIRLWPEFQGRDGCRTPFVWAADAPNGGFTSVARPWLPVWPAHLALAMDRQERDPGSMLAAYRAMTAFRRAHPALGRGPIRLLPSEGEVLAFERGLDGETLLCVFNLGAEPEVWREGAGGALAPLEVYPLAGEAALEAGALRLPPLTPFFARREDGHG